MNEIFGYHTQQSHLHIRDWDNWAVRVVGRPFVQQVDSASLRTKDQNSLTQRVQIDNIAYETVGMSGHSHSRKEGKPPYHIYHRARDIPPMDGPVATGVYCRAEADLWDQVGGGAVVGFAFVGQQSLSQVGRAPARGEGL